jgi:hypothetical protein
MKNEIGWCLIPPTILSRTDLNSTEKILLGRIYGLVSREGYCFASNEWLGEQIGIKPHTISLMLTRLNRMRLIRISLKRVKSKKYSQRKIYPLWRNTARGVAESRLHAGGIPLGSERDSEREENTDFDFEKAKEIAEKLKSQAHTLIGRSIN